MSLLADVDVYTQTHPDGTVLHFRDDGAARQSNTYTKAEVDALIGSAGSPVKQATMSIPLNWSRNSGGYWTEIVTVSGATITEHSKVDLQPSTAQINSLKAAGVGTMHVYNPNGTLYLYVSGNPPTAAMTMWCTVTEVE